MWVQNIKFLEEEKFLDMETQNIQKARPLKAWQNFEFQSLEKFVGNKKK